MTNCQYLPRCPVHKAMRYYSPTTDEWSRIHNFSAAPAFGEPTADTSPQCIRFIDDRLVTFKSTVRAVAQYVVDFPPSVSLVLRSIIAMAKEVFPCARPPMVRLLT